MPAPLTLSTLLYLTTYSLLFSYPLSYTIHHHLHLHSLLTYFLPTHFPASLACPPTLSTRHALARRTGPPARRASCERRVSVDWGERRRSSRSLSRRSRATGTTGSVGDTLGRLAEAPSRSRASADALERPGASRRSPHPTPSPRSQDALAVTRRSRGRRTRYPRSVGDALGTNHGYAAQSAPCKVLDSPAKDLPRRAFGI